MNDATTPAEAIATNGIRLNATLAGPPSGKPVILLHGFPEFSYGWRHQVGPLAAAGLRVVVPDQRGYNLSDKPEGVASYAVDALAADVVGLIDACGWGKASLVGHDWGGIVAWWVAMTAPGRVARLAVLNAPHPAAARAMWRRPAQVLRSWYVLAFQVPGLPERLLGARDWRALARSLASTSRPGTFTEADLDAYRRAWSQPGAIRSMVHWYRAALRSGPPTPADPTIIVPTLILWGDRDRFLGRELAGDSLALCRDGRVEPIAGASHWLQHEEPDRVNRLLIDFLS